jgi:hypothetical protein
MSSPTVQKRWVLLTAWGPVREWHLAKMLWVDLDACCCHQRRRREAAPAACKLASPQSPSHGQCECYFCQLRYFVLLYPLAVWRTVPNFVGPLATRRECHTSIKRRVWRSERTQIINSTKKCKDSLMLCCSINIDSSSVHIHIGLRRIWCIHQIRLPRGAVFVFYVSYIIRTTYVRT